MDKTIKRRAQSSTAAFAEGGLHPVLAQVYQNRGVHDASELDNHLKSLEPYHSLKDLSKAVQRLAQAVREQQRILIVGDFDADGATSTALAVSALRALGAEQVDYLVPNRFEYGYGLTPQIVEVANSMHPSLIITVDNGISSCDGVAAANARGIDVVITDHHLPAEQLPDAVAIVNPNQHGDEFPSKNLAGVGVIFYVMLALRRQLAEMNWFVETRAEPTMSAFLDLVALGTVADVVPLDKNNRILVYQGLQRIRRGKCRPGIIALLEIGKRKAETLVASDLGFAIAPRLNAAGRLDDMSLGIECLLTEDAKTARKMAVELDELNQERKRIEADMQKQAVHALKDFSLKSEGDIPLGLALFHPEWHQGVIGILASRIKERFHRPVIAFSKVSQTELKGSARSVNGIHIRDTLDAIAKRHPALINKFGGHAMAAGLSLHPDNFDAFSQAFIAELESNYNESDLSGEILTDLELTDADFTLELAYLLREAGPWGQAFPEPLFDGQFEIIQQRLVGTNHLKLLLRPKKGGSLIDAIAFNIDLEQWPDQRCQFVNCAYRLDVNDYKNRQNVQLLVETLVKDN